MLFIRRSNITSSCHDRAMRMCRFAVVIAVAALALPALLLSQPAAAAPVPVGHVVYVTANGVLKVTAVMSNGDHTDPVRLAPVTKVDPPKTVTVAGLVVSADKNWVAWSERIAKPSKKYGELVTGARIAVRNMYSGKTITLRSNDAPLGFAGSTLVTVGSYSKRLVKKPTPHLVRIPGHGYAVATYPKGIVEVKSSVPADNRKVYQVDRLRLTTFDGHHTPLHTYRVNDQYRSAGGNVDAVSADGRKLIVEFGNHQDFEGLGGSSNFDTFAMHGARVRHQLGHYGTSKARWRLAGATFVGAHNMPWLAIHSAPKRSKSGDYYVVRGFVVSYAHGKWTRQDDHAIAVAGNSDGYVVVQDGEWQPVEHSDAGEYRPVPGGFALLRGPHGAHYLRGIKAVELVWATKTDENAPDGR
jgi:hypothetical protein